MFKIIVTPLVSQLHQVFSSKLKMYGFHKKGNVYVGKSASNIEGVEFYRRNLNSAQTRVSAIRVEGDKARTI